MRNLYLKNKTRFYKVLLLTLGIMGIVSLNSCFCRGPKTKYGGPPADYKSNINQNDSTITNDEKNI